MIYITRISKFQFLVFAKCKQFLEISMDPSFFDSSYDRCNDLLLPRIEIPEGFKLNHQSVGNSVSFVVGREFQKLFLCFAFRSAKVLEIGDSCSVVSTNGYSEQHQAGHSIFSGVSERLLLRPVYLGDGMNQIHLNRIVLRLQLKSGIRALTILLRIPKLHGWESM